MQDDREVLTFKKILIDYIFEVGERFELTNLTIHIAVAYLERAYALGFHKDSSDALKSEQQLRSLAVCCLLLGAKYDELDDRIPFICDL